MTPPLTGHDGVAREVHDGRQADAEDGRLSPVEHREAHRCLQRRHLVARQQLVVAVCLVTLVVEVLKRTRNDQIFLVFLTNESKQ